MAENNFIVQNISWSSNESRSALSNSSFNSIPNEILLHIFRYLSVSDLCQISLVCRSFKMVADQDEIWKYKSNTSLKLSSKSYKQMFIEWMKAKRWRANKLRQNRNKFGRYSRTACVICLPPPYPTRPVAQHKFEPIAGFQQHPNSTQDLTISFSVDIDQSAYQLVSLLEKATSFQNKYEQSFVLKQMIQRYYRFMQLKVSQPSDTFLIPTLDIEIVWQTHLLRPEMYRKDCLRLFRRVIDHSLIVKDNMEIYFKKQAFLDTCQLYQQKFGQDYCSLPSWSIEENDSKQFYISKDYCGDDEEEMNRVKSMHSYWDETYYEFSLNSPVDYENPFSFTETDVILDLNWFDQCKAFMTKAMDKIRTNGYYIYDTKIIDLSKNSLKRLKKSYERFLYMAAKYPLIEGNGFIPPTYAIDIIWHSHMQEPLKYENDCVRLVGYVIYHDPWPVVEDNDMKQSCDKIDQIWRDEFQCEIDADHLLNTSNNINSWYD